MSVEILHMAIFAQIKQDATLAQEPAHELQELSARASRKSRSWRDVGARLLNRKFSGLYGWL